MRIRSDDDDYYEPTVFFGSGAVHDLNGFVPKKKRKRHPIGFHIPKAATAKNGKRK